MEVQFELENDKGLFFIGKGETRIGEMLVIINGEELTAVHTEVFAEGQGKGIGKLLFKSMIDYARDNNFQVTSRCTFVHAQFTRNSDEYADVWNNK